MMQANPDQDFALKTIKNRDVHFVRCWFSDVLGNLKSFAMIPHEIDEAFEEGISFDGGRIEGFITKNDFSLRAFPDASTFQILPWRPQSDAVARMFCTIRTAEGDMYPGDPRNILIKAVEKAHKAGYHFNVCPEIEFYYFKDDSGTEVLDRGGFFDLTSLDYASDLRRDTVFALEKMGIPVEYSHHEQGPSQHEIDLRYSDALSMADAVMTYKLVVKEIALKNEVFASFMPKPMANEPGSSMHVLQSLTNLEGENLFFDATRPEANYLSDIAKKYMAGLLKYAPEFSLITNQYVNSYKRLASDADAPILLSWAQANRSNLIRVPHFRPDKKSSCRIEYRSPDPATNPYLAFAVMLCAGLAGVEENLSLPPANEEGNLSRCTLQDLQNRGIRRLPSNLGEAIELFEHSALMRETLGEQVHSYLLETKKAEWDAYQAHVSLWELDRHLAIL